MSDPARGADRTARPRKAEHNVPHPTAEDPEFVRYLYLAYAIVYHGQDTREQPVRTFDVGPL